MKDHKHCFQGKNWIFWITGLGSFVWLLLRSGLNPRRLAYPCQRAALVSGLGFLGYLLSLVGTSYLYHRFKRQATPVSLAVLALALLLTTTLTSSNVPPPPVYAGLALPAWTSPIAISNVFVVPNVPVPECSLASGALPDTAPCNEAGYALRDIGVEQLVTEMENRGDFFFQSADHPSGIVGVDDVVVIKVNNQWGLNGYDEGRGRLSTNTDVLKGLLWQILQHPASFRGEIVIVENTQDSGANWDTTPANAQNRDQSYRNVVNAFRDLGYPVSLFNWDDLNYNLISGGLIDGGSYPSGEYATGNTDNGYILLEDPAGSGTEELSYPKFQTAGGNYVSMRYGVWNGSSYDAERLTFINAPVLKRHGMAGSTIAWKNLIGFVTVFDEERRYGDWDTMHDYFWGYTEGANRDYGLIGREMALIRTPDLNVVDAIWVADDNYDGNATRQNVLLAATDPFAVDWYASEYLLFSILPEQDGSAARSGIFRSATRTNQNIAAAIWPAGNYPYIDLLDNYNGDTPSDDEKNQLNVYLAGEVAQPVSVEPTLPAAAPPEEPVETSPTESPPPEEVVEPEETVAPPLATNSIDNFESGSEYWEANSDETSTIECGSDPDVAHQGTASLYIYYNLTPEGWADCGHYFESLQDWSGEDGLSLWLHSDWAGQQLTLMLFSGDLENPTPFEAYFETSAESVEDWSQIILPWTDMQRAEWADEDGLSEVDPARVTGLGFDLVADDASTEGTFWIDDIGLASGEVQPAAESVVSPTTEPAASEEEESVPRASEEESTEEESTVVASEDESTEEESTVVASEDESTEEESASVGSDEQPVQDEAVPVAPDKESGEETQAEGRSPFCMTSLLPVGMIVALLTYRRRTVIGPTN